MHFSCFFFKVFVFSHDSNSPHCVCISSGSAGLDSPIINSVEPSGLVWMNLDEYSVKIM